MNLRPHLVVDESQAPSAVPSAEDRLHRKRSDTQEPTLVFSAEEMALLEAVLGQVSDPVNILEFYS